MTDIFVSISNAILNFQPLIKVLIKASSMSALSEHLHQ